MSNGKKSYGQIIILIVVVSLFFGVNPAFASEITHPPISYKDICQPSTSCGVTIPVVPDRRISISIDVMNDIPANIRIISYSAYQNNDNPDFDILVDTEFRGNYHKTIVPTADSLEFDLSCESTCNFVVEYSSRFPNAIEGSSLMNPNFFEARFYLILISIVVVPIALTYLGIVSLKHFKPSWGNYIHSNRLLKIGLYFIAGGIGSAFNLFFSLFEYAQAGFLSIILAILFISIGVMLIIKSVKGRRTGTIVLIVGIGAVIFGGIFNNGYITILGAISLTVYIITSIYNKVKKKDYTPIR